MKFEPKKLDDGSLQITMILSPVELDKLPIASGDISLMGWEKTDYCVTCNNNQKYTIETYGDIAANIEAAVVCYKETGNPSYGLSKGRCSE